MSIGSIVSRVNPSLSRVAALLAAAALALSLGGLAGCSPDSTTSASTQAESPSQAAAIEVAVSVDASAADGEVKTGTAALEEGATVLDALEAAGFEADVQDSSYGKYVAGIDGLAAGDAGDMSGWLVALNGEDLAVSADQQEVSDGDEVAWRYVTSFE